MRNLKINNFVIVIVVVSGISLFIVSRITTLDLTQLKDFYKAFSTVLSIDTFLVFCFVIWGWKFPMFEGWLVPFPNLSGTWKGQILSDWVNPGTDSEPNQILAMLTIKQSFLSISCVMRTHEMVSHSYAEGFMIDPDRQIKRLAYIYSSKPGILITDRSKTHDGAIVFEIIKNEKKKLKGSYWTERKTRGEIHLEFFSEEILDEIPFTWTDN